ncbi:MAG: helix-turn-helix transcriptional regulator, partial [Tannerella sp.]|nr:helix-turn-helix transcriptional regulator [Tannerella sp.]
LLDGGYLVIRLLEQSDWQNIRDGHVYVVAEKDGRAFVKRLKNRFLEHGFIVCNSDSADVMRYPSFNLFENEINTIWHAEWYFTAKMPNINDTYYNRLTLLEEGFEELRKEFSQMRALQQKN